MGLVIRRADVHGTLRSVRVDEGRISAVAMGRNVHRQNDDRELDARGGALIPGLHDHHIHLRACLAARESVFVGPPSVVGARGFAAALSAAPVGRDGWIRAVGYHESVAGELDRDVLDRLSGDRPVRVQHRSGVLWMLNSPALRLVGAEDASLAGIERGPDGRATGRLWRMDGWLGERLLAVEPRRGPGVGKRERSGKALSGLSRDAVARGVTGWTDATPGRDDRESAALLEAVAEGAVLQRLHLMSPLELAPGSASGAAAAASGPVKVILDDGDLPSLEWLSELVSAAHAQRRAVAMHCVTRVQLALAAAAFESAADRTEQAWPREGDRDRIEHGAVVPPEFLPLLADRNLTVVTQPNFVYERGDEYLDEVDDDDLPHLWRARSLIEAGVGLAAGTDAPFGSGDPWLAVRASTRRLTRSGRSLGTREALGWKTALELWLGYAREPEVPRRIEVGQPADLVLLGAPLPDALEGDGPVEVGATIIGGEVVFEDA